MIYGLTPLDAAVVVAYFAAVIGVGFWAARRVRGESDFFLGGRKFGKGLLVAHWLCTGTHSDMAVQVAGATARVGLGGIWYQWMWLFSTPFYWLIAPVNRRLRVVTTGDFFRIRYGPSVELLYACVALVYVVQSIALLLRGAGAAISGATGGAIATEHSVIVLAILFSSYVMAGGLVAAAYTDFLQGVMIVVLSVLLVPAGLSYVGGMSQVRERLDPAMFSITAPPGADEGNPWFVIAWSVLGLVGVVVQPHVMSATGSGRTELEARVGMCYGNFIKRLLTVAWAFTGLIAVVAFPSVLQQIDTASDAGLRASETLFGRSIQHFLGDGWRGLMIACLIAGVTSAETIMVVGAAVVTRNVYGCLVPARREHRSLVVARTASATILGVSVWLAYHAESVTQLLKSSVQVIGLLGASYWLGVVWRRANTKGVWASFVAGVLVWMVTSGRADALRNLPGVAQALHKLLATIGVDRLSDLGTPAQIAMMLAAQFGSLVAVSLCTRPQNREQLDYFFARLLTPVGMEPQDTPTIAASVMHEAATLGIDGMTLDYARASAAAYQRLQRLGLEIPRLNPIDWGGFLAAWVIVGALVALLLCLARLAAG